MRVLEESRRVTYLIRRLIDRLGRRAVVYFAIDDGAAALVGTRAGYPTQPRSTAKVGTPDHRRDDGRTPTRRNPEDASMSVAMNLSTVAIA